MSKEELIQELTDIRSRFFNDINTKLSNLSENDNIHSELQHCKKFNSHILTRFIQLEQNAVTNLQYSKNKTIE